MELEEPESRAVSRSKERDSPSLTTKVILLFLAGTAIREFFAPITGHPFDFELWIRLGYYTAQGLDPYRISPPVPGLSMPDAAYMPSIGYPPVWPFILAGIYKLYATSGISSRFFYYFLLKQPMIIGDLLDAALIYKILWPRTQSGALKALTFWLFCPYTIIISSIWGMFDQLVLVFVLLSFLWLSKTKTSAVSESIGFLLKGIPLIYLPVLAFVQKSKTKIIEYLTIPAVLGVFFIFLPYLIFPGWNISALFGTGKAVVNIVGGSMSYLGLINIVGGFIHYPAWAYWLIFAISYAWIPALLVTSYYCVRILRMTGVTQESLVLSLVIVSLVFYLTRIQVNEQYLIYFLGLGLIWGYWTGSFRRKKEFYGIWLSALGFLIANNSFMVRFLDTINVYYNQLDQSMDNGTAGVVRLVILVITSISFSVFCFLYLRSVVPELKKTVIIQE